MNDTTPRYIKVGDALSQLFNVLLLPRHRYTNANESISGRAYRCKWKYVEKVINCLSYPFEKDHCRKSFEKDLARAAQVSTNYSSATSSGTIRIVMAGDMSQTRVYDASTGVEIRGICSIEVSHVAGSLPTAKLEFVRPELVAVIPPQQVE